MILLSILVSFVLSVVAKFLADYFLVERVAILGKFAGLQYASNPGIAFSIRLPGRLQDVAIIVALLCMIAAARYAHTTQSRVAFGLIIGGALANVVDRVRDGVVTDFLQVGTFPIFNVADSCITIGVFLLLLECVQRWRKA